MERISLERISPEFIATSMVLTLVRSALASLVHSVEHNVSALATRVYLYRPPFGDR